MRAINIDKGNFTIVLTIIFLAGAMPFISVVNAQSAQLQLWVWQRSDVIEKVEKRVVEFEEMTGSKVVLNEKPKGEIIIALMQLERSNDVSEMPDIFVVDKDIVFELAGENYLIPLDCEEELEEFTNDVLNRFRFGSRLYGKPLSASDSLSSVAYAIAKYSEKIPEARQFIDCLYPPVDPQIKHINITIDDAVVREGDSGMETPVTLVVKTEEITDTLIYWETMESRAKGDEDYFSDSGTLTISAGSPADIVVFIKGDNIESEGYEDFFVIVSEETADIKLTGKLQGKILILDDDGATEDTFEIPIPDPEDVYTADKLYEIYRKGLITRHICSNGLLTEQIALEDIFSFEYDADNNKYIGLSDFWNLDNTSTLRMNPHSIGTVILQRSVGPNIRIPIENCRFSVEVDEAGNKNAMLYAPVIGPRKEPGLGNRFYHVVSCGGDNPLYLSGFALATFSLEHIHGVSEHSLQYARILIKYMLDSEYPFKSGYIIRRGSFFNGGSNLMGVPSPKGASVEELLGTMLGIMYYLRAEDPNYYLYEEAQNLRNRIFNVLESNVGKYAHPSVPHIGKLRYGVGYSEFPLFASANQRRNGPVYRTALANATGTERLIWEVFDSVEYWQYAMMLTSAVLVLEGLDDTSIENIIHDKEWWAKFFMTELIKEPYTEIPDIESLSDNAYMGVLFRLINKHINNNLSTPQNPNYESEYLISIWGDNWETPALSQSDSENQLRITGKEVKDSVKIITEACSKRDVSSLHNDLPCWQHNLPFFRRMPPGTSDNLSANFNVNNKIGWEFIWLYPNKKLVSGSRENFNRSGDWWWPFPGWYPHEELEPERTGEWDHVKMTEKEYCESNLKWYEKSHFVIHEIKDNRGHETCQIEGAGLGLLFLRMLLTDIDPDTFRPPVLENDKYYPVLPFSGGQPPAPRQVKTRANFYKHSNKYRIRVNMQDAVKILVPKRNESQVNELVMVFIGEDKKLKLQKMQVQRQHILNTVDENTSISPILDKTFHKTDLFDAKIVESSDEVYIIVTDLKKRGGAFSKKWDLNVSLWDFKTLKSLDTWTYEKFIVEGNGYVSIDMYDDNKIVMGLRKGEGEIGLQMLEVNYSTGMVWPYENSRSLDINCDGKFFLTVDSKDTIIILIPRNNGFEILSGFWSTYTDSFSSFTNHGQYNGELLDITTTYRMYDGKKESFLVAASALHDDSALERKLCIKSWEVINSSEIKELGSFKQELRSKDKYINNDLLLGYLTGFERASIQGFNWYDESHKACYAMVAYADGYYLYDTKKQKYKRGEKGLKVILGSIMENGQPTVTDAQVYGSSKESITNFENINISTPVLLSGIPGSSFRTGILTAHNSEDNCINLAYWERDPDLKHGPYDISHGQIKIESCKFKKRLSIENESGGKNRVDRYSVTFSWDCNYQPRYTVLINDIEIEGKTNIDCNENTGSIELLLDIVVEELYTHKLTVKLDKEDLFDETYIELTRPSFKIFPYLNSSTSIDYVNKNPIIIDAYEEDVYIFDSPNDPIPDENEIEKYWDRRIIVTLDSRSKYINTREYLNFFDVKYLWGYVIKPVYCTTRYTAMIEPLSVRASLYKRIPQQPDILLQIFTEDDIDQKDKVLEVIHSIDINDFNDDVCYILKYEVVDDANQRIYNELKIYARSLLQIMKSKFETIEKNPEWDIIIDYILDSIPSNIWDQLKELIPDLSVDDPVLIEIINEIVTSYLLQGFDEPNLWDEYQLHQQKQYTADLNKLINLSLNSESLDIFTAHLANHNRSLTRSNNVATSVILTNTLSELIMTDENNIEYIINRTK